MKHGLFISLKNVASVPNPARVDFKLAQISVSHRILPVLTSLMMVLWVTSEGVGGAWLFLCFS